jgi:hypothetical protein
MANCKFLLNDGASYILLNDGISFLLMNDNTCGDFELLPNDCHMVTPFGGSSRRPFGEDSIVPFGDNNTIVRC